MYVLIYFRLYLYQKKTNATQTRVAMAGPAPRPTEGTFARATRATRGQHAKVCAIHFLILVTGTYSICYFDISFNSLNKDTKQVGRQVNK